MQKRRPQLGGRQAEGTRAPPVNGAANGGMMEKEENRCRLSKSTLIAGQGRARG